MLCHQTSLWSKLSAILYDPCNKCIIDFNSCLWHPRFCCKLMFLYSAVSFSHNTNYLHPRPYPVHACPYLLQHSPAVEVMDQKMSVKSNTHNVRLCLMTCYWLQWTHSTFIMLYHWSLSTQVNKHHLTLCTSHNNMAANKQKSKYK